MMHESAETRRVLTALLARAAERLHCEIVDSPLVGWQGRTVGVRVRLLSGQTAWLRVVTAPTEIARGDWWEGNVSAADLRGLPRPAVLAKDEWTEERVTVRAEVMEFVHGRVCAATPELHHDPLLGEAWWEALEDTLERLAVQETTRLSTTPASIIHRSRVLFGRSYDLADVDWTTVHGDLHWANLFDGPFMLVDWEAWGAGPAGSDIAGLYLHSLLVPSVANTILERFPRAFTTFSGRIGLVFHASRILARAMSGDYADLVEPVHQAVREFAPPTTR